MAKGEEIAAGNSAKEAQATMKKNMADLDNLLEREEEDFYLVYKQLSRIIEASGKSDKTQEMYRRKRKEHVGHFGRSPASFNSVQQPLSPKFLYRLHTR